MKTSSSLRMQHKQSPNGSHLMHNEQVHSHAHVRGSIANLRERRKDTGGVLSRCLPLDDLGMVQSNVLPLSIFHRHFSMGY
mmetsp:Transcript_4918/g.6422  ORF Transcript_4918/g.6422 Transcript_4918/m.6422 type:complete len:81 (-) Transcript_4918:107-349(-)